MCRDSLVAGGSAILLNICSNPVSVLLHTFRRENRISRKWSPRPAVCFNMIHGLQGSRICNYNLFISFRFDVVGPRWFCTSFLDVGLRRPAAI